LIPNPIHKVLSTLCTHEVRYLLMGGQACVFYGAAEFSRDCDIAIVCDAENISRLQAALRELDARQIAVPEFAVELLERGHAAHFRCQSPDAKGVRIDVMAKLRGVAPFEELWSRRTTLEDAAGVRFELMALADLVAAKKTQRDKDWPMLRRLIEAHYAQHRSSASVEQIEFWLRECRTPEILLDLVATHPAVAAELGRQRPLLQVAAAGNLAKAQEALVEEEQKEREVDRQYWEPLKRELEQMSLEHRSDESPPAE
jgi:hypothetical protein